MGECDQCGKWCKDEYSFCYNCYKENQDNDSWEYEEHSFTDWGEELRLNSLAQRLANPSPLEYEFLKWLLSFHFINADRSWFDSKQYPFQFIREFPWEHNNHILYYDFCLYLKYPINLSADPTIPIYSNNLYPRMLLFELDGQQYHQTSAQITNDQIKTEEAQILLNSYQQTNYVYSTQFYRLKGKEILSGDFKSKIINEL